jgi:hypothetical protein
MEISIFESKSPLRQAPGVIGQAKRRHKQIMKEHYYFFIIILLLLTTVSFGQSIDLESEKFPGTKKLIVESFNGCCAQKGYKAIYYFDSSGRTIKSSNYFKRKLLASYEYRYNDKGLLTEKITLYDIKSKSRKDTTKFTYTFDQKDRVITKTKHFGTWTALESYTDFDALNNPTTIIHSFNNTTFVEKRQYNSLGQEILNQRLENDTITSIEEIKYNQFGNKIYSNMPTLIDNETGKMVKLIGGTRHWFLEEYLYTYDNLNRWTEKYVVYDNKNVLLEKRIYK